jgi:hypothetical protein
MANNRLLEGHLDRREFLLGDLAEKLQCHVDTVRSYPADIIAAGLLQLVGDLADGPLDLAGDFARYKNPNVVGW